MTTYPVAEIVHEKHGQSWDKLRGFTAPEAHPELYETAMLDGKRWIERFPNFAPQELASRGNGLLRCYLPALDALQRLRTAFGVPIIVTSAYRDPVHNRLIGGAKRSRHLAGAAFDFEWPRDVSRRDVVRSAIAEGFNGIGQYADFVHVDCRAKTARWRG